MNCIEFIDKIDDFIDDYLPRPTSEKMAEHKEICPACQEALTAELNLRHLLQNAPVPKIEQSSLERMMRGAKREHGNNNRRKSLSAVVGAIAAGLVIFLVTGLHNGTPGGNINNHRQGIVQVTQLSKTVNLLVNCKTDMDQAELTIILPDNVELASLPGQRQVTWKTDLKAGSNLLPLEIVALTPGTAQITARVEHHDKSRTKILNTSI